MRRKASLTIRGEDHIGDPLGAIFLEPEQPADSVVQRLREYLGGRVRILKAVLSKDQIEMEVESLGLREESNRLLDAASRLRANGLGRSAQPVLRDALELDPLSGRAMVMLGEALSADGRPDEAFRMLVRAREVSGETADLLAGMAACCLKLERKTAAVAYLKRSLELDSRHFAARRTLLALGHKPPASRSKRGGGTLKLNLK